LKEKKDGRRGQNEDCTELHDPATNRSTYLKERTSLFHHSLHFIAALATK
jgi:hypothetical protein